MSNDPIRVYEQAADGEMRHVYHGRPNRTPSVQIALRLPEPDEKASVTRLC